MSSSNDLEDYPTVSTGAVITGITPAYVQIPRTITLQADPVAVDALVKKAPYLGVITPVVFYPKNLCPRKEIQFVAIEMEHKLAANDHKGHWRDQSFSTLFSKLQGEVRELEAELFVGLKDEIEYDKVIKEAADVCNFAMMVADNARRELAKRKENLSV